MTSEAPFRMTLSLNVLNHLGLNLYSNIPSVLSEVVANSYDADAEIVRIDIDRAAGSVVVFDNGVGMTAEELNERFLNVGYQRRLAENGGTTLGLGRKVMGRKGIGKLSLLSIADVVEVYTAKDGQKSAFRMDVNDIRREIEERGGTYHPAPIDTESIDFERGTRIVLHQLKKGLVNTASALRKRLARRFSVLGSEYKFTLFVDGEEVTIEDRDYFHRLQFVWTYETDDQSAQIAARCTKAESIKAVGPGDLSVGKVTGWIGTAANAGRLRDDDGDNLNKIFLMVRGKLAHEDLLEEISDTSMYSTYLIGEIHADFLDLDEQEDIATSSRQRIVEEDPRFRALLSWLKDQLKVVKNSWSDLRNERGTREALQNPLIESWFETLQEAPQKKAKKLFGKVNEMPIDASEKAQVFSFLVLAFETLRYRENLSVLDNIEASDITLLLSIFQNVEDLEAALYHQIVRQRLSVIQALESQMDFNALEKVLQKHLFENLWLLDPSWERATDRHMEERVGKSFAAVEEKLTEEEKSSRIDIRYKRVTGSNVIVELKRYDVVVDTSKLIQQVDKYRNALFKYLEDSNISGPVEAVCVVGKDLSDWGSARSKQESVEAFKAKGIRVVKYDELLKDAQSAYGEYLERSSEVGRIRAILDSLTDDSLE
ncbi:ATP-binding protein [Streptomyces sp. NBC_00564]|uniref:BbrUII/HgiDII family restriction enzyme n=1 Tax=Streptomyces sp. NBC_00564 TaxID=2903663 RepID=UPI00352BD985|nr:ATP-binding protein [Streptomyces sp. NBC_00564]